jgi:hypothetical protein
MPKFVRSIRQNEYQPSLGIYNNNQNNYLFGNKNQSPLLTMNYTTNNNNNQLEPCYNTEIIESPYHHNPKYGASKYICSLQSGKMHKLINNTSK